MKREGKRDREGMKNEYSAASSTAYIKVSDGVNVFPLVDEKRRAFCHHRKSRANQSEDFMEMIGGHGPSEFGNSRKGGKYSTGLEENFAHTRAIKSNKALGHVGDIVSTSLI